MTEQRQSKRQQLQREAMQKDDTENMPSLSVVVNNSIVEADHDSIASGSTDGSPDKNRVDKESSIEREKHRA